MRSASIQELKAELTGRKSGELISICLRLARFKKENKELLTYLLFEAQDEESYIRTVKADLTLEFEQVNRDHLYFAKKTLRKIVRLINKYARYSGSKQTETELRIFFCQELINSGIPFRQNAVISNLYDTQFKKITVLIGTLHADLQHDYSRELEKLIVPAISTGFRLFGRRKK